MRKEKKENYIKKAEIKKRYKNSQELSNVEKVEDNGIIRLKTKEYAKIYEIIPVDLSLSSNTERTSFFNSLKSIYQINNLNLKFYKLDKKINLNENKIKLNELKEKFKNEKNKINLIEERENLIKELEENNFTISSVYYMVLITREIKELEKQENEMFSILNYITPTINIYNINNKLEIYQILSNIYLTSKSLDSLLFYDLPNLISPINFIEKANMLYLDNKQIQMISVKNLPPFVSELFLEEVFNVPKVRACINVRDTISQEELIRWVNNQYQFLLADRNTTKKLSDATELDVQKENFQVLMQEIKTGDEKIKEVSLILVIEGDKEEREEKLKYLKHLAETYQIKLEVPRLRQLELWQSYDITSFNLKDYSFYLPSLTLSAGFPFTKTHFNDSSGYMLGVDLHTSLPIFFDPFTLNNLRPSHNMSIISSTGGGKSFTMKKMIINEFSRGTKIFVFDAENEYKNLVLKNGGEYIDLYSKKGGIINPLQIRYIPSDDEDKDIKETDCPLAKHLGFLEAFFKSAFENINEKEIVMLLAVVEELYKTKNIYKNTSINTLESLKPEDYPIFSELYSFLPKYKARLRSREKEKIIDQLEILLSRFLTGTDNFLFDGHTTINLNNDLIAFNLQELLYSGNQRLINTQTLNLLTYLNNSIVANKIENEKSNTIKHISIIVDEFHLFIDEKNNEVLRNFGQLARRCRKYSTNMIFSTQCLGDFLTNASVLRHAKAIFNNSQYLMVGMLKEDDLKTYLELFNQNELTETQKHFLINAKQGEFLLNIDRKTRLRIWVRATELERKLMGES